MDIPARSELTVLGPDEIAKTVGFSVRENSGSPVFLIPPEHGYGIATGDDSMDPPIRYEYITWLIKPEKALLRQEDIQVGSWILARTFGGVTAVQIVSGAGDEYTAKSLSGNAGYFLMYDRQYFPHGSAETPTPTWVCWGQANLKGLSKLTIER